VYSHKEHSESKEKHSIYLAILGAATVNALPVHAVDLEEEEEEEEEEKEEEDEDEEEEHWMRVGGGIC
jgi:hypothetical protein